MSGSEVLFDHISIATPRMADAVTVLVSVLGGVPDAAAPARQFRWACWRFEGGGRLEVIEPRGADGFLDRFLAQRGPGIHHVTFKVPDLRAACDRAAAHGYRLVGYDDSDPNWKEAFLHPKEAQGMVVQLAQAAGRDDVLWPWDPPPTIPDPPPPVAVRGLRTTAASAPRAERLWGDVLAGKREGSGPGEIVYRWPGSPMRVVVDIDPSVEEGPTAIELGGGRARAIPADAGASIGTRFVSVE